MARKELAGWKDNLIHWCVMRQHSLLHTNPNSTITDEAATNGYYMEGGMTRNNAAGMQGRPNKLEDTCYSYWIGGTLHLLHASHLLDGWALREYVLECQSPYGGFGKVLGAMPDLLHSFYSLAWLSLSNEQGSPLK
jgi:prenyltransferase beta subunit